MINKEVTFKMNILKRLLRGIINNHVIIVKEMDTFKVNSGMYIYVSIMLWKIIVA